MYMMSYVREWNHPLLISNRAKSTAPAPRTATFLACTRTAPIRRDTTRRLGTNAFLDAVGTLRPEKVEREADMIWSTRLFTRTASECVATGRIGRAVGRFIQELKCIFEVLTARPLPGLKSSLPFRTP